MQIRGYKGSDGVCVSAVVQRERRGAFLSWRVACYQVVYLSQRGTLDVHTKDERYAILEYTYVHSVESFALSVISIIDISVCLHVIRTPDDVCGDSHLFKILRRAFCPLSFLFPLPDDHSVIAFSPPRAKL
jgi:hypothetical protein